MAISRRLLKQLIENDKIVISPYNEDQLQPNGYLLRLGSEITQYDTNDIAFLDTSDSQESLSGTTYTIPDSGFVLDPRRIYRAKLVETVWSDDYSIQISPYEELATHGITANMATNIATNPSGPQYITLTSIQPATIYQNQVVAIAYFTSTEGDGVPSGGIIMWSGNEVPSGWLLCDGTEGTPNLRDRFVLGWGSRSIGDTGGEEEHRLTIDEIPSHSHDAGSLNVTGATNGGGGIEASGASPANRSVQGNTGYTGGDGSHNNMPPYYVLAFIMKI